jgi:hypothetical protein
MCSVLRDDPAGLEEIRCVQGKRQRLEPELEPLQDHFSVQG